MPMSRTYTIRQFAELAGVSMRALRHYDRLGLLSPPRSEASYRLYRDQDLETLEQIVALKFIGLPLKQVKAVLHRDRDAFARALAAQRIILGQKRKAVDAAIQAIEHVEQRIREGKDVDARRLKQIIEVLDMQNDDAATKYQTLLDAKISRLKEMSAERRAELGKQWAELFDDVEKSLNEDPAGSKAQELAARWVKLLEVFNKGAAIDAALMQASAFRVSSAEWPKGMQSFRNPGVWDFIGKALAAREGTSR
jgi:DNA-binding transcriptional MerR regulator